MNSLNDILWNNEDDEDNDELNGGNIVIMSINCGNNSACGSHDPGCMLR